MVRSFVLLEHIAYKEGEVRVPVVSVLGIMYIVACRHCNLFFISRKVLS